MWSVFAFAQKALAVGLPPSSCAPSPPPSVSGVWVRHRAGVRILWLSAMTLPALAEVAEDGPLGDFSTPPRDYKQVSTKALFDASIIPDAAVASSSGSSKADRPMAACATLPAARPATTAARSAPQLISHTLRLLEVAREGRRAEETATIEGGDNKVADSIKGHVVDALSGATAALPADVRAALDALLGLVAVESDTANVADDSAATSNGGATAAMAAMVELGGVPLIVQAMTKGVADEALVVASMRLLEVVVATSTELASLVGVSFGGVEAVLEGICRHRRSLIVQSVALRVLLILVRVEAARGHCMDHLDGMWLVLDVMRTHQHDNRVQAYGCHLLASLAFGSSDARELIGSAGGFGVIVGALSAAGAEPATKVVACTAVRNLAWMNATNHRRLAVVHGVEAVLAAVADHPDNQAVNEQALGALGNISFLDARLQERILSNGGVSACIKSLAAYCEKSGCVSENALTVLSNLSENDVGHIRPVGRELVATSGTLRLVVGTLGRYMGRPPLVMKSCNLLRSLCYETANRRRLGLVDGVRTLLGILDAYPVEASSAAGVFVGEGIAPGLGVGLPFVERPANQSLSAATVHSEVHWALATLVAGDDANKDALGLLGGLPKVLASMAALPTDQAVQRCGANLLDTAADGNAHNIQRALVAGALTVVYAAMQAHLEVESIQEHGCSFMIKLTAESGTTSQSLTSRGAEAFLDTVRKTHSTSPTVVSLANQLLSLIAADAAAGDGRGGRSATGRGGGASARLRSRSRAAGSDRSRGIGTRDGSRSPSPRRGGRGGDGAGRRGARDDAGGGGGGRGGGGEGGGRARRFGGLAAVEEAEAPATGELGSASGGAGGAADPPLRATRPRNRRGGLDLLSVPE